MKTTVLREKKRAFLQFPQGHIYPFWDHQIRLKHTTTRQNPMNFSSTKHRVLYYRALTYPGAVCSIASGSAFEKVCCNYLYGYVWTDCGGFSAHLFSSLGWHVFVDTPKAASLAVYPNIRVKSALQRCATQGRRADGPWRVADKPHCQQSPGVGNLRRCGSKRKIRRSCLA